MKCLRILEIWKGNLKSISIWKFVRLIGFVVFVECLHTIWRLLWKHGNLKQKKTFACCAAYKSRTNAACANFCSRSLAPVLEIVDSIIIFQFFVNKFDDFAKKTWKFLKKYAAANSSAHISRHVRALSFVAPGCPRMRWSWAHH